MAHISVTLQFWLPDMKGKRFMAGGAFTKGEMLANVIAGDLDGQLDGQISYGDLKVKMDDDIPDDNGT